MKCEQPVFLFLPILLVQPFFAEVGNQFSHGLVITTVITRDLQMNATGQLNRLLWAVY